VKQSLNGCPTVPTIEMAVNCNSEQATMVSAQSIAVGVFIMLMSTPLLVFPQKSARIRYRHARDSEPTEEGIREARLTGGVIFLTGLLIFFFY